MTNLDRGSMAHGKLHVVLTLIDRWHMLLEDREGTTGGEKSGVEIGGKKEP
jgi:hypothetical protein